MQPLKWGAEGATTLIFKDGKFIIPGSSYNALKDEKNIERILKDELSPINDDIIIIASDNSNYIRAELASKAAALYTLQNHVDHKEINSHITVNSSY